MINSNMYNYIDVLDKAADAAYLRNDIIANNIANNSTPNYKRQDVQFESILQASLATGGETLGEMVERVNMNLDDLNSYVYTDHSSLSYRLDGNNVDIDQEQAYLAENQIRYQALVDQMTQEFGRYKTVLSS
ncbi:MAG: flagellar basal body rod protein FlgB [Lachnospiraceae bacterium]|nr:flagellar basal body rod protein FlgB [Lachnospiraceae bacterium]